MKRFFKFVASLLAGKSKNGKVAHPVPDDAYWFDALNPEDDADFYRIFGKDFYKQKARKFRRRKVSGITVCDEEDLLI